MCILPKAEIHSRDFIEKKLMKKFVFLLSFSALFITTAFAQAPVPEAVGVVTRVEGLVTVSQGNTMGNAFKDQVIVEKARVVTTASGSTTIRLNNGCVIDLKPNQVVTVDRRECKAILAAIQSTGAVGGAGVGAVGVGNGVIVVAGVVTSVVATNAILNSNENSVLQRLSGS